MRITIKNTTINGVGGYAIVEPTTLKDVIEIITDEMLLGNKLWVSSYYIETGHWKAKCGGPRAAVLLKLQPWSVFPPEIAGRWADGATAIEIIRTYWNERKK